MSNHVENNQVHLTHFAGRLPSEVADEVDKWIEGDDRSVDKAYRRLVAILGYLRMERLQVAAPDALRRFECRASDDTVKRDLELTCTECGEHVCDVEDGDSLETLAGVASEP